MLFIIIITLMVISFLFTEKEERFSEAELYIMTQ